MSTDLFIPTIWSEKILHRLKIALAFASTYVCNHDYEGDIAAYGDSVKIHGISDPTISDYVKNVDMDEAEVLDAFEQILLIDQGKSFHFQVDDVDKKQSQPQFISEAMDRAGYGLALVADAKVAALLSAATPGTGNAPSGEVLAPNIGTAAAPIPIHGLGEFTSVTDATATSAYELLIKLGVALDEQKVPRSLSRFAVVPPWIAGELAMDPRTTGLMGINGNTVVIDGFDGSPDANGFAGRIAGFNVITSLETPSGVFNGSSGGYQNTSSTVSPYNEIIVGVPEATSFANQIVETEAFRSHKRIGDVMRGLHVYGIKVVWPERLVAAYVAPGT